MVGATAYTFCSHAPECLLKFWREGVMFFNNYGIILTIAFPRWRFKIFKAVHDILLIEWLSKQKVRKEGYLKWKNDKITAGLGKQIVAAFRGVHVSPAKHYYASLPRKWVYRIDRHTDGQKDAGQSDPYVLLCFTDDTKMVSTIRAYASPKRGRNQVSGRVSVPCWHAKPFANAQWKNLVIRSSSVSRSLNWC